MSNPIISLVPSATEIVTALGLQDQLVGRSHECDFPEGILSLPVCSEPAIDVNASSGEIDRQVKNAVANAASIYKLNMEELNRLQPTHLITQTQCEVCAVSLQDVQQAIREMVGSQPEVISHNPNSLSDIWNDIQTTADQLGVPERGHELVATLKDRLERVRQSVAERTVKPSVVCLEWFNALMAAGNWVPELVEIAGGVPLLCEAGKHSPYFEWSNLHRANPDVIAIIPCGFDIPRTISELGVLFDSPDWFELRAVRQGRVYLADGNQFFNRPGPRIVESAEILVEILHDVGHNRPDQRHHQTGWIRLEEC